MGDYISLEKNGALLMRFSLISSHQLAGDQEGVVEKLNSQLRNGQERCVLLGVTGSGKTFTMAHLIENIQRPTLIISHNKTLARQLWEEMKDMYPTNAVEYFVSYYDYYQPEAYLPQRDLYIDKELSKNERIEQERFSTVASLVTRPDTIIIASVSCIYGLNPPKTFLGQHTHIKARAKADPQNLIKELVKLQYTRTTSDLSKGCARLKGEILDIWMPSRERPFRIKFELDEIHEISVCDPIDWKKLETLEEVWIHPKEFFMTDPETFSTALNEIERDLEIRAKQFNDREQWPEAARIRQRTEFDLEMLRQTGHCNGVENYSRYFDRRGPGERPYCLLDFMRTCAEKYHGDQDEYLVFMDESHVTLPQIGGMYAGDRSRKENLIQHGFRLPSAYDNRPLEIREFQEMIPKMIYVSATPGPRELRHLCEVTGQAIPPELEHAPPKGGGKKKIKSPIDKGGGAADHYRT